MAAIRGKRVAARAVHGMLACVMGAAAQPAGAQQPAASTGYEAHSWYGFVVPAKTPQIIVVRLNKEIVQILNQPDAAEAVLKQGLEVWTSTPELFGAYIKSEYDK